VGDSKRNETVTCAIARTCGARTMEREVDAVRCGVRCRRVENQPPRNL
jgi:hypothetical protein